MTATIFRAIGCNEIKVERFISDLIFVGAGTGDLGIHLFQTTGVAAKVENISGSCLLPIDATDTLELWVRCTSAAATDVIFDHVSLSCSQVGG